MLSFHVVRDATLSSIEALMFRPQARPDVAILLAPADQRGTGFVTDTQRFFATHERFKVIDSYEYDDFPEYRGQWLDRAVEFVGEKIVVIPTYNSDIVDAIRAHRPGVKVKVYDMRVPEVPTRRKRS